MLTKLTLLFAAASANIGQRLGGSTGAPTGYGKYVTAPAAADAVTLATSGYGCLRTGYTYAYPMMMADATTIASTADANVRAFFGTSTANLGTGAGSTAGTWMAMVDGSNNALTGVQPGAGPNTSGCFMTSQSDGTATSATQSLLLFSTGTTAVPDRLFMYYSGTYATDNNASNILINLDFALSGTNQISFSGAAGATRAAADYCDVQLVNLASQGASASSATIGAMTFTQKCTYIAKAAAGAGAPAFKISNLGWWKFQLHYAEWNSVDVSSTEWLTTSKYFGTYAATTYPNPVHMTSYPSAAAAGAKTFLTWGQTAMGAIRQNWEIAGKIPGSWKYDTTMSYTGYGGPW